jgi:arylsulfatase A-like enzyme
METKEFYSFIKEYQEAQVDTVFSENDLFAIELGDKSPAYASIVEDALALYLGEKGITGKNTLWENSTRVPLIFAGPGVKGGQRCLQPAELLDMYPTLIALCGLPKNDKLEGLSLMPQLKNVETKRERPAITSHNQGNHAVRSERYRYIHYADGSEEFYDMESDPDEWENLAKDERYGELIRNHRKWLPKKDVSPAPGSAHRVLVYDKEKDEATWINQKPVTIHRHDLIPQ